MSLELAHTLGAVGSSAYKCAAYSRQPKFADMTRSEASYLLLLIEQVSPMLQEVVKAKATKGDKP